MNISLPDPLKEYVQGRVADGEYSTPSDYMRALIREDMKRRAADWLERALLAGLNSGPGRPLDLEAIRAKGRQIAGVTPAPEA
jgi:antitoxin ParD1/3/4